MPDTQKLQALKMLLGEEANALLNNVEFTEKSVVEAGVAYKSHDELDTMTADELLDYALVLKEAEESEEMAEEAAGENSPLTMTELKAAMSDFRQAVREDIKAMMGTRKEVTIDNSAIDAVGSRVDALKSELDTAIKELNELRSEQPRALQGGYRATVSGETVEDEEVHKEATDPFTEFGASLMNPVWEAGGN